MQIESILCLHVVLAGCAMFFMAVLFVAPAPRVHAQTTGPQFLITWKATGSYVPPWYSGKSLASYGSKITASVELISGKQIVGLKSYTIYWYLNDTLIGGGVGVTQITFPPFGAPPNMMALRVQIQNYNGGLLTHTVQIPMVNPEAVIYAPYPNNQVAATTFTARAFPFFFNVPLASALSYSWSVNGQTGTNAENPDSAQINLPAGTPVGTNFALALTIKNSQDSTLANAVTNLTYASHL